MGQALDYEILMDVHKRNSKPLKILSNWELCFYSDSSHEFEEPFIDFWSIII